MINNNQEMLLDFIVPEAERQIANYYRYVAEIIFRDATVDDIYAD